jgi:hypothetical protein
LRGARSGGRDGAGSVCDKDKRSQGGQELEQDGCSTDDA